MKKLNPLEIKLSYGELAPEVVLPPGDRFDIAHNTEAKRMYHKEKSARMLLDVSKKMAYRDMVTIKTEDSGYNREGYFVPVRIYRPDKDGKRPVIMFFHGGGWVLNDINIFEWVCRYLAFKANAVVLNVDYRLAPVGKFPTGLHDCYGAIQWLYRKADILNADVNNITVTGDSAGGNFSAVCAIMSRDLGGPPIKNQILIYPGLDLTDHEYYSMKRYAKGYFLEMDPDTPNPVYSLYLESPEQTRDPYVSPMLTENLKGLPRTMFISAECDPIVDHAIRYAKRLAEQDVPVDFYLFKGMYHGFITDNYKDSFIAMDKIAEFIVS